MCNTEAVTVLILFTKLNQLCLSHIYVMSHFMPETWRKTHESLLWLVNKKTNASIILNVNFDIELEEK